MRASPRDRDAMGSTSPGCTRLLRRSSTGSSCSIRATSIHGDLHGGDDLRCAVGPSRRRPPVSWCTRPCRDAADAARDTDDRSCAPSSRRSRANWWRRRRHRARSRRRRRRAVPSAWTPMATREAVAGRTIVAYDALLAVEHELDRPPRRSRQERRHRLEDELLLAAERPAHGDLDHAHLAVGQAEEVGDDGPGPEHALGRAPDGQLAARRPRARCTDGARAPRGGREAC